MQDEGREVEKNMRMCVCVKYKLLTCIENKPYEIETARGGKRMARKRTRDIFAKHLSHPAVA